MYAPDLREWAAGALESLDCMEFGRERMPEPPVRLRSDAIVMKKKFWTYDRYFRAELVDVFGTSADYGALACTLMSMCLHHTPDILKIDLRNPLSDLRVFAVQKPVQNLVRFGITVELASVGFHRRQEPHDVLSGLSALPEDEKPRFLLQHSDWESDLAREWSQRDHLELVSSQEGLLLLTSALLSFRRRDGEDADRELDLRPPPPSYNDRLGSGSAIVRFWLPESFGWPVDYIPVDASTS